MYNNTERPSRFVFLYLVYAAFAFASGLTILGYAVTRSPYYADADEHIPLTETELAIILGFKVFLIAAFLVCQFAVIPRSMKQIKRGADSNDVSTTLAIGIFINVALSVFVYCAAGGYLD
jgi:hypothetical protein